MPQFRAKSRESIKYVSVLDEDGSVDESLVPDLSEDRLLDLYRTMVLARRFDERMLTLQREGRIGTFAPVKGQEASQLGAVAALRDDDWVVPSYRETACALWRGVPMDAILVANAGYNEGGAVDPESRNLPDAVPVGTQPLHAVGIGYALKLRQEDSVAMTFFGDGATSEGDLHEALNFAGVFGTPTVFVCENNQWAISVPRDRQTAAETIAQKAVAYGFPGVQVDGNDVLAVHRAARDAVERARAGDGPSLIECVTYRMEVHTTADDPGRYRDEGEVEKWEKRDPLIRYTGFLRDRDVLTEARSGEIADEVANEIDEAWEAAQRRIEGYDDPLVIFDHHFAERPASLERQRDELERELARAGAAKGGAQEDAGHAEDAEEREDEDEKEDEAADA